MQELYEKVSAMNSDTVGHALAELERVGLVKRHWGSRSPTQPYHSYIKLPATEDKP